MLMRKLGRTGLRVSALCLGGNTFGWTTDQKASEAVLDAYVEAAGNFIDTADVYSRWAPGNKGGESETALGVWMTARRNRHAVLIATLRFQVRGKVRAPDRSGRDRGAFAPGSLLPSSGRGRKPIAVRPRTGGDISSRIASKTTLNCASYFFSSAASLRYSASSEASI